MSYKLIAFDMDGTLLDSGKKITANTLQAIKEAVSCNKVVALSTGRCLPELYEYIPLLKGVRYLICVSGGCIYDTEQENFVYKNALPDCYVEQIMSVAEEADCMIHLLSDLSVVQKKDVARMDYFGMGIYRPMYERVTTMVEDIHSYYYENHPEVMKLNLYHSSEEGSIHTKEQLAALKERTGLDIEMAFAEKSSLECSNRGITKGKGLLELCRILNIPLEETIAVGDADNDRDILLTAGLSIAMGNARDSIREICDVVVADNDHDGCAEAIYQYLLK